ncbi:MAG: RNB domain-containing ribonuclease [Blastocatellia bacterium]|nr:RNB domain-containing ribonuclease [Blastocatellia bacterium]
MTDSISFPEFQQIRDILKIPVGFDPSVQREAEALADRDLSSLPNQQEIPFITIDPPTSRDLDQAFFATRQGEKYVVKYAIADVGFFVERGSVIEEEAWRRGLTMYSPDLKTPLYPAILSEGAASLLPQVARPAIVFSFRLNTRAEVESFTLERTVIRSYAKLAYPDVSLHLDAEREITNSGSLAGNSWSESLTLLEEIGRKREQLEAERGGVSLRIPAQQVERWSTALHGYRLAFEEASAVEGWNAQISLMTGMAAAQLMIERGVGLLRALEVPRPERVQMLRLTAHALQISWPDEMTYPEFVRSLDPKQPLHAVMLHQAARVTGGARYVAFEGEGQAWHSAIAAPYAHVTAPLRRLADRYVLDLLVELTNGHRPSQELMATLYQLPPVMSEADRLSRQLESAIVDFAEARLMQDRAGEIFNAMVIGLRQEGVVVQVTEPPLRTLIPITVWRAQGEEAKLASDGATLMVGEQRLTLGETVSLRLEAANPKARSLSFSLVQAA